MTDEDQPPEDIWLHDELLKAHFEMVHERHRDKSRDGEWESVPQPMDQNEMTRGLKRGK